MNFKPKVFKLCDTSSRDGAIFTQGMLETISGVKAITNNTIIYNKSQPS